MITLRSWMLLAAVGLLAGCDPAPVSHGKLDFVRFMAACERDGGFSAKQCAFLINAAWSPRVYGDK